MRIVGLVLLIFVSARPTHAQVSTGSNGSDGALSPPSNFNLIIDMTTHPNGIYQYTSVNIPPIGVSFAPNSGNAPVIWLVQGDVTINGTIDVSGQGFSGAAAGLGGPGGWKGGIGGPQPTSGQGPGGGLGSIPPASDGANASYGGLGTVNNSHISPGPTYGNVFLIPLIGGSGGGGSPSSGGGGGGGAILIAAGGTITLNGEIRAFGGAGGGSAWSGGGSGGAVRLVASRIAGTGHVQTTGGSYGTASGGGIGRVRFDTFENTFAGYISGVFSQGSQFIIIPASGQLPSLSISSIGGIAPPATPTGVLATPDAILAAQQNNPISVVVSCVNLPLNSLITVSMQPAIGQPASATGYNTVGTLSSSTATIPLTIPRGGGIIYATATAN